ncbi:MAG: type II toxin-antitoxin system RelE/ParE family toxin [Thermoanaerobaculaceae bacterium]|nr:type II toxin-antitoxin system RelE/ParE family toxin [Thermoanaerobaculaceae bacterium]
MTWTVRYTETAAKAIKKLDPTVRERVRAAIDAMRQDPHRGKPLQLTLKGLYSWRTGDWRIVYRIERQRIEVVHATLGHRREVYTRVRSLLR